MVTVVASPTDGPPLRGVTTLDVTFDPPTTHDAETLDAQYEHHQVGPAVRSRQRSSFSAIDGEYHSIAGRRISHRHRGIARRLTPPSRGATPWSIATSWGE